MPVPDSNPLTPAQRKAAAELLRPVTRPLDDLARLFTRRGHQLALVGGPVRDVFLRRRSGDTDLATDASPEQVLEITAGWADASWTVGIEFGTVGLRKDGRMLEITTFRSERYTEGSRKPAVRYENTLEGDLGRRDFTVNAMAARLPSGELVDPFGGLRDLREKVLRTPGTAEDSFTDDPLRMLRAARFAAQLGF
jgi:poly(A) polymerase